MARSVKDLSVYRYERASEELANARDLLAEGKYKLALNRSYYAIFSPCCRCKRHAPECEIREGDFALRSGTRCVSSDVRDRMMRINASFYLSRHEGCECSG